MSNRDYPLACSASQKMQTVLARWQLCGDMIKLGTSDKNVLGIHMMIWPVWPVLQVKISC